MAVFETPLGSFTLSRSSVSKHEDRNLQAWDSADEYLLTSLADSDTFLQSPDFNLGVSKTNILILNDSFGALSLPLIKRVELASAGDFDNNGERPRQAAPDTSAEMMGFPRSVVVAGDSRVSRNAIEHNAKVNKIALSSYTFVPEGGLLEYCQSEQLKFDWVLMKLPKALEHLKWQLAQLQPILSPLARVLAAGKTKQIHTSTVKAFESAFTQTKTSLAVKKSRLIVSDWRAELADTAEPSSIPQSKIQSPHKTYELPEYGLKLISAASVFSSSKLDYGSQLLLKALKQDSQASQAVMMDLGCGNGVLGLAASTFIETKKLLFVDESYSSVASAEKNFTMNVDALAASTEAEFIVDNVLDGTLKVEPSPSVDLVLCNPPFHQQNSMGKQTAHKMIRQSLQVLRQGGGLCLVGNRHLAYHSYIKKVFGNCETLESNSKFVVLKATKR